MMEKKRLIVTELKVGRNLRDHLGIFQMYEPNRGPKRGSGFPAYTQPAREAAKCHEISIDIDMIRPVSYQG